jgi:hypothetical protein
LFWCRVACYTLGDGEPGCDAQGIRKAGGKGLIQTSGRPLLRRGRSSEPEHEIAAERDVLVATRDGTRVAVDIFKPRAEGRFPALFAVSPYGKDVQFMGVPQQPAQSITFDHSIEAGNIEFFVARGYAFVVMDLRGCGKSEGDWLGFYNGRDQRDCYDVIEWIAQQPWCDGNVGMSGHSYFGAMQLLTAAQQPPHLKVIAPIEAMTDHYNKAYPGGITSPWYSFVLHMVTVHDAALDSERLYGTDGVKARIASRLKDPDISTNSFYVREFNSPRKNAAFVDQLLHPTYGPFWEERSAREHFAKIKVPTFTAGFWGYFTIIDGTFEAFTDPTLDVPKRVSVLSYGTANVMLPLKLYDEELLRWYDHWLKGVDTGLMEEPPVNIYIPGRDVVRRETEWPLARTQWTAYYLRRFGELSTDPEGDDGQEPDPLVHTPPQISARLAAFRYRTRPLSRGVETTGPAALHLFAELDAEDANFIATIYDVAPSGNKTLVSRGYLRASHRAVDRARSKPGAPFHSHRDPAPVHPGAVEEYAIKISPLSNYFAPGHAIELEIATSDAHGLTEETTGFSAVVEDKMNAMGVLPSSRLIYYKLHRSPRFRSHLLLPVIPEA